MNFSQSEGTLKILCDKYNEEVKYGSSRREEPLQIEICRESIKNERAQPLSRAQTRGHFALGACRFRMAPNSGKQTATTERTREDISYAADSGASHAKSAHALSARWRGGRISSQTTRQKMNVVDSEESCRFRDRANCEVREAREGAESAQKLRKNCAKIARYPGIGRVRSGGSSRNFRIAIQATDGFRGGDLAVPPRGAHAHCFNVDALG